MVFYHIFYRVAFLITALIHLWWNDLIKAFAVVVVICLSNPKQNFVQSIFRLHSLVLISFVLGFCFHAVSADQAFLSSEARILRVGFQHLRFEMVQRG